MRIRRWHWSQAKKRSTSRDGPRSGAGKNRSSRNAYRHGLSIASSAAVTKQLDKLVRKIAGDTEDPILLERARALAQAELDLARVRRAKVALIERASAFGELDPPPLTISQRLADLHAQLRAVNAAIGGPITFPEPIDSSATMPPQEPDRSAEAIRGVLPELRKLERYERRAAAQPDRALFNLPDKKR